MTINQHPEECHGDFGYLTSNLNLLKGKKS